MGSFRGIGPIFDQVISICDLILPNQLKPDPNYKVMSNVMSANGGN
jgi:hypothetical protein